MCSASLTSHQLPARRAQWCTDEAIRSRATSLALSGLQLLSEIPNVLPTQLACELWKQKDRSFLCCGLPGCIWMHSLHKHRVYLLPQRNPSMGADQDTTGVSWGFRQKRKKFQLQDQSGWSSLYKAMHGLANQNTVFYIHERAQIILIKIQQSDLYLLQSLRLINFKIPLVPGFGCVISFVCNSLFLWQIKSPLISNTTVLRNEISHNEN